MTTSQTLESECTGSKLKFGSARLGYAIAISLFMHLGAALVFINTDSFILGGKNSHTFLLQEIDFLPTLDAPAQQVRALPEPQPAAPATKQPSEQPKIQQSDNTAQEPSSGLTSQANDNSGKIDGLSSSSLGLGMTHGYFSGLADGRSLRDDIRGYYFEMVEKINREWWGKAGQIKEPLRQDGVFDLLIQRDGTIVSIRMVKGTGSIEADRLLTEIIRSASPLPALPPTYDLGMFRAPLRIKAPSILFR